MSYSNYSSQAKAYREREILSASPGRLVVIVFDHVLANLFRAKAAGESTNLALRLESLGRARDGVMELLATVDVEKGGSLGVNLRSIYGFVFNQLLDEARTPDASRLQRITAIITDLRDAFASISAEGAQVSAA
jgi:flagellar secretion chaperone FliS